MKTPQLLLTQRILWFALLSATFLHMVIAFVLLQKMPPRQPPDPTMPFAFGVVAISAAGASFFVPKVVYAQNAKNAEVQTKEEIAPSAFPDGYRGAMPKRLIFADPVDATYKALAVFQAPLILSLALSEAVALCGLVLTSLGFDATVCVPFFLAGAILIAIRFPQLPQIRAMFEKARGASFSAENS